MTFHIYLTEYKIKKRLLKHHRKAFFKAKIIIKKNINH